MKFCLITGPGGEGVKHIFLEEARKFFDKVVYAPLKSIRIECDKDVKILFKNENLGEFDAVYVRALEKDFIFAEIILEILESQGVYMPTFSEGFHITNNKYHSIELASRIGVPVADSSLTINPKDSLEISKDMGFPIILKLIKGFGGRGVMLIKTEEEMMPILDTLQGFDELSSLQKFIPSDSTDYRALVIGDEIVGIERKGKEGEWRANVSTGGTAKIVKLDKNMKEMSLKIAELLGLSICSIDFVRSEGNPVFIEANFTPGIMSSFFKGGLANKMIRYIYKKALEKGEKK